MRQIAAEQRSFTTPAVITLVLYIVFWLPGFIANNVYLVEANGVERITGRAQAGMGCLQALLVVAVVLPLIGICAWLVILASEASSSG